MTGPSEAQIAEWQRLADEATPGPWEFNAVDDLHDDAAGWVGHDRTGDGFQEFVCTTANHPDGLNDGAFIAAAREAVPALLAQNAALAARLAEVERGHPDAAARAVVVDTLAAMKARAEQAEAERDEARAAVGRVAAEQRQLLQALPHDWREQYKRAQGAEATLAAVASLHADTGGGWCAECHTSPCKTRAALRGEAGEGRA